MATWTQADIDQLKTAVASGILTVRFSGPPERHVTYQSLAQMRELLAEMRADVARQGGAKPYHLAATRKGV
jgi:hypothetical protein